ncbi:response regulator [Brevundimonas sp.]|uniref:response regulator n=1 Tax=Brevundimonas sp. TaxID=1871086 RepID=UPI00273125E6|nr:response regulator [Brevundimonas sp.]MDP1913905.1 response regulator [Brevundimonas sp.]
MIRLTEMPEITFPADELPDAATILMVEDNAEVRAMGETLLVDAGFAVHTAGDAAEALAMVESGLPFDLLFSDIVMPGKLDGEGLSAEVTRLRPGTPVLLTTGWTDRAREHAGHRPEWDLIAKPYRQTDLVWKIRMLLERGAVGL